MSLSSGKQESYHRRVDNNTVAKHHLGYEYVPPNDKGITQVVRIRRHKGEIVQDCDVYIGREQYQGGWKLPRSEWANPYSFSNYGNDRSEVVQMYKEYIMKKPKLLSKLHELKGKR